MGIIYFFIFFLGLALGSFLNCVIYRLEEGQSFLRGRSFCPHCKHSLSWKDLVPLFSFVVLRGRCRYCQNPISWQYPLVEFFTAGLFVFIFNLQFSVFNIPSLIYYWTISCFLIIIFVYDLKHYIIPDRVVYPAILISGLWYLASFIFSDSPAGYGTLNVVYSALGAAGFFLAIVLVSRGKWMGVGDIKLAILMGLFLGFPNILVALFLAFFLGAVVGIGLLAFKKKGLRSEVPFGPFLISGTFLALFRGVDIANWYLNLILVK